MNFDLSLIDKVASTGTAPARASKFAPRARARPQQKPDAEKPPEAADKPTSNAEAAPAGASRGMGEKAGSKVLPEPDPEKQAAGTEDTGPSAVPPQERQPAELERLAEARAPPQTRAEPVPVTGEQPASQEAAIAPAGETARPQKKRNRPEAAEGGQGEQGELAVVPVVACGDLAVAEPSSKRKKVATGKRGAAKGSGGKKALSVEEQAAVVLHPGMDSIKNYVDRAKAQERLRNAAKRKNREADAEDEEQEERLALQAPPESVMTLAPQLELVEGRLVPKQQSMMVQAQAQPSYRRVTEYNSIINNSSHSNRMNSERWTADETEAFYQAVKCFGPNFELISKLFPGRPRKALANKWRRESKNNPERIDEAYAGGGSLAGLQKVVEALGNTETTADGDVGDLGMDAAQMFGLAGPPPGQEGDDEEEEAKPPPKKRAARKPRKTAQAAAATAEGPAEEGKDASEEPAAEPQAGVSFRKEGSKRKPKKTGPASAAADSSQAAPKKGAKSDGGGAKRKRAARKKLKADSEREGSSDEESDFEAPAESRPAAPSGRVTRSQPASLQAETISA